jgi:hypothetical protein
MGETGIYSDHLLNWSEYYAKSVYRWAPPAAEGFAGEAASSGGGFTGVFDRALPALRESKLPLPPSGASGTWPQILFVSQSDGAAPRNGLYFPGLSGPSQRISAQFPDYPENIERGLRYQPGTPPPRRTVLEGRINNASCLSIICCRDKSTISTPRAFIGNRYFSGQYAANTIVRRGEPGPAHGGAK